MKTQDLVITNIDEFKKFSELIENVNKSTSDLPERVFCEGYNKFFFEEFDWTMTEEFSVRLKQLLVETNEPYLLIAVLEPNPSEYYFNEFGYYNWVKIPYNILDGFYYEAIEHSPEGSIADSILFNSKKIVWTVPSGKWAIWGDRNYGVCILGCTEDCQIISEQSFESWKTVEEALNSWMKLSFRAQNVPIEFKLKMISNYRK